MQLIDKFGYLSVDQIHTSPYDGQIAYLPKQGGQGDLAVLTTTDVTAWAPLATETPPCVLVVNYEDQSGDWMGGGYDVGVQKGQWIKAQLDALGITNIPCVYLSADFHPGGSLNAVLDCLRGAQSVLGNQARAVYGFVETLDAARAAGLADHFWLCGSQDGLNGRPWIDLWQHNNDQGSVDGVTVDINDARTANFGQWIPAATSQGDDMFDDADRKNLTDTLTTAQNAAQIASDVRNLVLDPDRGLIHQLGVLEGEVADLKKALQSGGGSVDMSAVTAAAKDGAAQGVANLHLAAVKP